MGKRSGIVPAHPREVPQAAVHTFPKLTAKIVKTAQTAAIIL